MSKLQSFNFSIPNSLNCQRTCSATYVYTIKYIVTAETRHLNIEKKILGDSMVTFWTWFGLSIMILSSMSFSYAQAYLTYGFVILWLKENRFQALALVYFYLRTDCMIHVQNWALHYPVVPVRSPLGEKKISQLFD